jgi:ParB family chromosome partitioning protein
MTKPSRNIDQPKTEAAVQLIEARHLEKSPLNVRRTVAKGADAELKASILAHGLMQNLVVTAAGKGTYHVIAGARRLEALHALQKEKKLPADYLVPCQVVAKDQAEEMSLAENTVRQAMHPADEFEAFAKLADTYSAEQIAQRFGTTEKHVLQRLKLGKVAPELLKQYRAGEIGLESLMAFTITDDHKHQLKVYRSLQGWQKDNANHIRRALTQQMVDGDNKLAKFVGLKAYEKAGGHTRADLFGEETYLEDPEIVHRKAERRRRQGACRRLGLGRGSRGPRLQHHRKLWPYQPEAAQRPRKAVGQTCRTPG